MEETQESRKKSPNLDLRKKIGNYVIGEIVKRIASTNYPGNFSTLLKVEETNGSTVLDKKEVDIDAGDTVFFNETRWINKFLSERRPGERIKLTYIGVEANPKPGRKAAFMYDTEVL